MFLASACMFASCIGTDVSNDKVNMSADVEQITAQAEFVSDGDNVRKVVIRSNRSWFAHLDDLDHPVDPADPAARVGWASLSLEHHQNLTNTIDETEIDIIFNENPSTVEVNGVLNIWCEGKIMLSIPVSQSGCRPYVSVLAECDGRVASGQGTASLKIRANANWTAEVVESQLDDFTILNTSGGKSSRPQEVQVSFTPNPSSDPYDIKSARVRFTAEGMEEPVEFEFKQRGTFTVSFEDMSAFSPEIPNTLVSASGQPSNMSRPDRINTDVDQFVYTQGNYSVTLEMSQYIRYDSPTGSLYVMGAGKIPYVKFSGMAGLTITGLSVGCVKEGWFSGNIVSEEHVLENAGAITTEYTSLIEQESWEAPEDGQLHYLDYDLSQSCIAEGAGCTFRTSSKNGTNDKVKKTKMYIKTVTFKYL